MQPSSQSSDDMLDLAINDAFEVVYATQEDDPNHVVFLHELGDKINQRFRRTLSMDDLNLTIDIANRALDITSAVQNHPCRPALLSSLGGYLGQRFQRTGCLDDLNHAISLLEKARLTSPRNDTEKPGILNDLGILSGIRFQRTRSQDDLDRAINTAREALHLAPSDHAQRAEFLNNFTIWLHTRYERTGSIEDLNLGIETMRTALATVSQDDISRATLLQNFGSQLGDRFQRTGNFNDLDSAIDAITQAADLMPPNHAFQSEIFNSLGIWLRIRFEQAASTDDMDRAVESMRTAVEICPQDHPARAVRLNNLANSLGRRSERMRCPDNLDQAIDAAAEAVDLTPQDFPRRAGRLRTLSLWLLQRSDWHRNCSHDLGNDLERAVDTAIDSVEAVPPDDPDRASYLNHLTNCFGRRFERNKAPGDLDSAVDSAMKAVDATPKDSPHRAGILGTLGLWRHTRFEETGSDDDLNHALLSYQEGCHSSTAAPSLRIDLAKRAAEILISKSDWKAASQLLREAVYLLPRISPRSSKHIDIQVSLARFHGLATTAAAVALNADEDLCLALQLLELGRGVIAGTLMDTRGDITDLKLKHPELASEFISLRDKLDSPTDGGSSTSSIHDVSSWEATARRQREANEAFNDLLARIRAEPEFRGFLMPPEIEDLKATAVAGPIIVVNLSVYRSDAFLVEHDRIRLVGLPGLKLAEAQEQVSKPRTSIKHLEWLWNVICRPILDELSFTYHASDDNWPRVWWIPTGILQQFPLHAAGLYEQQNGETVLDRVMSSYASSIRALRHGRQIIAKKSTNSALLVAMSTTPNISANGALPFASNEVKMLEALFPSLGLTPVTPSRRKSCTLQHLKKCEIFHFAGHGESNTREPSQSQLLLEDWESSPLTVEALRDSKLQENPPFLAYLSACSTGASDVAPLADEGIHLVSALQLAGFRHVVGTLWEVSDKHCVEVAKVLYETIRNEGMTDIAVCRGLHRALRALRDVTTEHGEARNQRPLRARPRDSCLRNPYWIPYVHFGA